MACEGVAALHERHIYGWSAHAKNVYRVGEQMAHRRLRQSVVLRPGGRSSARRATARSVRRARRAVTTKRARWPDWLWARHHFGHWSAAGWLPYDQEREHRLRLDDCAMLGGLLVEMLTGKRWEWFFRALNAHPYCSATYPLTGDPRARCAALLDREPLLAGAMPGRRTTAGEW